MGLHVFMHPTCPPSVGTFGIMADTLIKDYKCIMGGDFNMIERQRDKSNDYECAISDLKRYSWNELLSKLQVHSIFIHQGGPQFSWNNGHVYSLRGDLSHMKGPASPLKWVHLPCFSMLWRRLFDLLSQKKIHKKSKHKLFNLLWAILDNLFCTHTNCTIWSHCGNAFERLG